MSFTLWVLPVFTNDIKQREKQKQKKNELKTAKFKNNLYLVALRIVDADVSFIDWVFALHEVRGCNWLSNLSGKKKKPLTMICYEICYI